MKPLFWAVSTGPTAWLALEPMRIRALRRLPIAFGLLTHRTIPHAVTDRWIAAARRPATRRDLVRFAHGVSHRHTQAAAERFGAYAGPVLIAWGADDIVFRPALAQRLAAAFPHARSVSIPDARTFVMEDQPDRLAEAIGGFLADTAEAGGGRAAAA